MNNLKSDVKKIIANVMYKVAENSANTTSCFVAHQPVAPSELNKLKK